jgi:tRNA G18 (ribose-2'-O)-methylase SpoU
MPADTLSACDTGRGAEVSCDTLVRLDLPGPIKSLNVSNAAALALYALRA